MSRITSSGISNSDRIIGITLPLFSSKREKLKNYRPYENSYFPTENGD